MSYILRNVVRNVINYYPSCRSRNDLLLRNKPCVSYFLNNFVQTRAAPRENSAIDAHIKQLDHDARRYGRLSYKDVNSVVKLIKATRSASVTQSLMIIRCCGSLLIEEPLEKRSELVQEVWEVLESLGVNLDIGHYNALLRVYLENDYDFTPSDVLADLDKRGLEPNRVTYQRLITRYCQLGDIAGATRILEFMREKGMPVNVTVFNALIMGHSQANDMVSAEGILNVMTQANIEPSAETYTQLMCGFIKQGDIEKYKNLLQTFESREFFFSDKDYFDIIYALAKYGYENEADEVISKQKRVPGYNQEAINAIFRLLSIGKSETAFKILKTLVRSTRSDGSVLPLGAFFISHLVRSDYPPEAIFSCCDILMKENLNPLALNIAMENSLRFGKDEIALSLFRKAKQNGVALRPHYFWPLLVSRGKKRDRDGLFDLLSVMQTEFNLSANTETLREIVMPFLVPIKDVDRLLVDLKSCGCSVSSGVSSIVFNYLTENKIDKAAAIASRYRSYYFPFIFRRPLVFAFTKTLDIPSFVAILREMSVSIHSRGTSDAEKADEEELQAIPDYRETIGHILIDAVKELQRVDQFPIKLEQLLEEMLNEGIGITADSAKYLHQVLQNSVTSKISELLEKLTSQELSVPQTSPKDVKLSLSSLDEKSLERLYETLKANNEPLTNIRRQLFHAYGRSKNLEKLLKMKEELEQESFVLTPGMKVHIIDCFVEYGKLDEALQVLNDVREQYPDFSLKAAKLLRLVLLLVQNDQVEKALEMLSCKYDAEIKDSPEEGSFLNSSICWRILNVFAEKGDVDRVNEFFNEFIKRDLTEVNNILLGPLIKVHLVRNDIDSAMKVFEKCCEKYRATPWKHELSRAFIEKEDAANLQKLTDLSTPIHGEVNSLYDLMFSFLECGRVRQAKKILETPGLRVRHDRIQHACTKYTNEGAVEHLENMLELTKGISSVNRSDLFYSMLQAHDRADNPENAMSLWIQMQEEDVQPSDQFLFLLAKILNRHNMPVPFSVPSDEDIKNASILEERSKIRVSRFSQILRKHLQFNEINQALELKQKNPEKLNLTDWSLLVHACVKQNEYDEAVKLFDEVYSRNGQVPHLKYLRLLFNAAATRGDLEFLNKWKNVLSAEQQRGVLLETRRVQAYSNVDKFDEYLEELRGKLNGLQNETDDKTFMSLFPQGGLLSVLQQKPDHAPKVLAMINEYKAKGFKSIILDNFWWIHLMTTNQLDAAQKYWDENLKNTDATIRFPGITRKIVNESDLELAEKFLKMFSSKEKCSPGILGIAYGSLITVLTQQNKIDEALRSLKEAVDTIPIDFIIRNSLIFLKTACETQNISFPYTIPSGNPRDSIRRNETDSDSDSD